MVANFGILEILSFLEYLVFFAAVFCTQQFECASRVAFRMFLTILNYEPK